MNERPRKQGKKRLLVVPSTFTDKFRVRSLEFASHWANRFEVHVWRWHWLSEVQGRNTFTRRARQLSAALFDVARRVMVHAGREEFQVVDAPFLQPALVRPILGLEAALRLARWFNGLQLRRVVRILAIDSIVMASAWFDMPELPGVYTYYDLVDWFNEDGLSPKFLARNALRLHQLLSRTNSNFAVSVPLQLKLAREFQIASRYLPNGVDINALRGVGKETVKSLRQRLSLQGHWVLGYIGNHDDHAGLDFLLEVFLALRERVPEAALLVVGPYARWKKRLHIPPNAPVRFTGQLPPTEIAAYCQLQDIAVHPCEKSQFRDYAFPLKVIEATAAGKLVVSTDLLTLRDLHLPNVYLLEKNVRVWVEVLESIRHVEWQTEWDRFVESFDWQHLADTSADWMEQDFANGLER